MSLLRQFTAQKENYSRLLGSLASALKLLVSNRGVIPEITLWIFMGILQTNPFANRPHVGKKRRKDFKDVTR